MRVTDVRVLPVDDGCELQAQVQSDAARFEPFRLWYRLPPTYAAALDPDIGDPFLVALLPLAMATGEPLRIPAPVSHRLLAAVPEVQSILLRFDERHAPIAVDAPVRPQPDDHGVASGANAIFFSLGVDSF